MSETDSTITATQPKPLTADCRVAQFFGYSVVAAAYAAIFGVTLVTLGLILVRQTNVANFNYLIAALDERDRVVKKTPDILENLQIHQKAYNEKLRDITTCAPEPIIQWLRASFDSVVPQGKNRPMGTQSTADAPFVTCEDLQKMRSQAAELKKNELELISKQANLESWYQSNTDGIRNKMPQIIPALRFLDSDYILVNVWARSPIELMQMYLLVLMGMLGGMIKATEWLIKPAAFDPAARPSWSEYFYKPALGGGIALGVFVAFKGAELIIVGPAPESTTSVAASIFLLAALGLVSGFGADKALEQIEKAATHMFSTSSAEASSASAPRQDFR
jgi:hypothetical protein